MKRFAFSLAAFSAACLIGLILCEVALWVIAPLSFHEWLVWEPHCFISGRPIPNQEIRTAGGDVVRINKFGFRGPDHEFEKEPGTLRIQTFGGSSTFCYKAAGRENTWPGALERKLSERLQMPVEVINFGLPGFTILESKFNYQFFGRAFDRDAIVVYHTWNDMSRFRSLARGPITTCTPPSNRNLWQRVLRATQIGRRLRIIYFDWTGMRMDIAVTRKEGTGEGIDRPVDPKALAWERQAMNDMAMLARSDDVLAIFSSQAGLAGPDNLDDPEIRRLMMGYNRDYRGFTLPLAIDTWMQVSGIIEEVAKENGAIFVDGWNAVPHDVEYVRDNVHLYDKGNDVLAEAMADTLLADPRFMAVAERVRAEADDAM